MTAAKPIKIDLSRSQVDGTWSDEQLQPSEGPIKRSRGRPRKDGTPAQPRKPKLEQAKPALLPAIPTSSMPHLQKAASLEELLTKRFPKGADMAMIVNAGFRGNEVHDALRDGHIKMLDDGRYTLIASPPPIAPTRPDFSYRAEIARAYMEDRGKVIIAKIHIGRRRRTLSQGWIEKLAHSITEIGLQTPITVADRGHGWFVLIAGHHRLEAAKQLGWDKIPCVVVDMDELTRQLWEIDENLCRAELNELERGEHLAARKEIYEQLHPETRQHVSGAVAVNAAMGRGDATDNLSIASFAADTAEKTGLDERTIRRSIHRAEHITPEVREAIRDMPEIADKGVELDALAKTPPEQQAAVVSAVKSGEAPNVRAAVRTNRPTGRAASNSDKRLDSILEKVRLLGKWERETLWETLADQWHEEMSRALACRLPNIAEAKQEYGPH